MKLLVIFFAMLLITSCAMRRRVAALRTETVIRSVNVSAVEHAAGSSLPQDLQRLVKRIGTGLDFGLLRSSGPAVMECAESVDQSLSTILRKSPFLVPRLVRVPKILRDLEAWAREDGLDFPMCRIALKNKLTSALKDLRTRPELADDLLRAACLHTVDTLDFGMLKEFANSFGFQAAVGQMDRRMANLLSSRKPSPKPSAKLQSIVEELEAEDDIPLPLCRQVLQAALTKLEEETAFYTTLMEVCPNVKAKVCFATSALDGEDGTRAVVADVVQGLYSSFGERDDVAFIVKLPRNGMGGNGVWEVFADNYNYNNTSSGCRFALVPSGSKHAEHRHGGWTELEMDDEPGAGMVTAFTSLCDAYITVQGGAANSELATAVLRRGAFVVPIGGISPQSSESIQGDVHQGDHVVVAQRFRPGSDLEMLLPRGLLGKVVSITEEGARIAFDGLAVGKGAFIAREDFINLRHARAREKLEEAGCAEEALDLLLSELDPARHRETTQTTLQVMEHVVSAARETPMSGTYAFLFTWHLGGVFGFTHSQVMFCDVASMTPSSLSYLKGKEDSRGAEPNVPIPSNDWQSVDNLCYTFAFGGNDNPARCSGVGVRTDSPVTVQATASKFTENKQMYLYGWSPVANHIPFHHVCARTLQQEPNRCGANWDGDRYNLVTVNCNKFSKSIMHCELGLSSKLPFYTPSGCVQCCSHPSRFCF